MSDPESSVPDRFLTMKTVLVLVAIGGTIGIVLSTIFSYQLMGPSPPENDGALWPLFAFAWSTPGFGFGSGLAILGGWAYEKIRYTQ